MTDTHTLDDLCDKLRDIAKWRPLLNDAQQAIIGLHSPRLTPGGRNTHDNLPYNLASILDAPDIGPQGIRSAGGIAEEVEAWRHTLALHRREETVKMTAASYLCAHAHQWHEAFGEDYPLFVEAVTTMWGLLARVTGHVPQHEEQIRCPSCGGTLTRDTQDDGLSDTLACKHCGEQYADDAIAAAVRRLTLLGVDQDEDLWVTWGEIHALHPNLKKDTLKKWAARGHVRRDGKLYALGDVNMRARPLAA